MPLGRETVGDVWVRVHADGTGLDKDVKDELDDLDPVYEKKGEDHGDRYNRGFLSRIKAGLSKLDDPLRRLNSRIDVFAGRLGRLTGKGSRNNALNFFGRLNEGLVKLVGLLPKAAQGLTGVSGGGSEGASGLSKALGSVFSNVAALTAAFVGITALLAPLVAGLSMLTAILTSLVISLGAAAAAVGALAFGLGVTLVAAVGVGVLALQNLDDETKKVAKSVGKEFQKLGKSAGEAIGPGLREALRIVKPAIAELEPLVDAVAEALGKVAIRFAEITESEAYKKFIDSLTKFLPGAIESLGNSMANVTEGFMGVFRAMEPMLNRFLGWLEKITGEFSEWANSKEGQRELKNFFKEAGDSAAILGDLIANIAEAIGNLAKNGGKDAGDTILQDLTDQVGKLADWLGDPKNRKKVRQWFEDGVEAARHLGRMIGRLLDLIDALDGPKSRKAFNFLVDAIGKVFQFWAGGVRFWGRVIDFIFNTSKTVSSAIAGFFKTAIDKIVGFFKAIPGKVSSIWDSIKTNASNAADAIVDFFKGLPDKIVGFFSGLGGRISDAIGSIDIDWPSPPGWLSKVGGGVAGIFSANGGVFNGAQARIIGEAGPEAVVPLNRPLGMVDPSVRALSAFAQGLPFGGVSPNSGGKTLNVGPITINTPTENPRAVAVETVNRLALVGGF